MTTMDNICTYMTCMWSRTWRREVLYPLYH